MIHRHIHENSQKQSFFLFKKISKPNMYMKNVCEICFHYSSFIFVPLKYLGLNLKPCASAKLAPQFYNSFFLILDLLQSLVMYSICQNMVVFSTAATISSGYGHRISPLIFFKCFNSYVHKRYNSVAERKTPG